MSWRPLSLGVLLVLVISAPAAGHGRSALFPSLTASAGHDRHARRVERRVRAIETSFLGADHAAEHARQRVIALRELRSGETARRGDPQPDNSLPFDVGGAWAPSVPLPIVAINAILLHTGKVLYFAYPYRPNVKDAGGNQITPAWSEEDNQADAFVFDPATGQSKEVTPPINPDTGHPAQIFCAGASTLPDGRVLVVGGDVGDPTQAKNQGLNTIYVFDPVTETWKEQVRMHQGRWYPTQLELPDGRTVIMSGAPKTGDPDDSYRIDTEIEIFSPDGTLQRLNNFQLKLQDDNMVPGAQPGITYAPIPGQYPHLFWMPSGHALVAGPRDKDTWRFFPPAAGADDARWEDVPDFPTTVVGTTTVRHFRDWASALLLPGSSRVMLFGGSDRDDHTQGQGVFPSVNTTTVFDDANPAGGWTAGPTMGAARAFANAVSLPDGKVAVIGGGRGETNNVYYRWQFTDADRAVDLFNPLTNAFTTGNSQAEGRTYHSTALLLPDGRVMSAGDDINGSGGPGTGARTDTAEIWSPPYLFDDDGGLAPRPVLDSAPDAVGYGQGFGVSASGADVTRAVLIAPAAVTHDNDMSQRVVPLAAPMKTPCGLLLTTPAGPDLAPPGYYMLFLLDADGVPSKARFVRLDADVAAPAGCPGPAPTATASVTTTAVPTVSPTPTPTPSVAALKVRVKPAKTTLKRLRRTRRLSLSITVSRSASVRVLLRMGARTLAPARSTTVRPGTAKRVRLTLSRAGRRRLRGVRRTTLALRVTAVPSIGDPVTVTRRLRVR